MSKKIFDLKWFFYDFVKWTGFPFVALFYRIKKFYIGKGKQENQLKGNLIICANHCSYDDAAKVICGLWKRRIGFLASKSLFKTKIGSNFFKSIRCISVDKTNFDVSTIRSAINVVKDGHSICIFPEGKINNTDLIDSFQSGIVMTAFLSNADILPVYLCKRKNVFNRTIIVVGEKIKINSLIKNVQPTIDEINTAACVLNEKEKELKNFYELK